MLKYGIKKVEITGKNEGIIREWSICRHFGIIREKHDSVAYNKGSDFSAYGKNHSVKASGASLMSGKLCQGLEDFEAIWDLYEKNVHSDTFDYITKDYTVYEMNINEFKKFVFTFGRLERESKKNGEQVKIKLLKESKKMINWLEGMAIA